MIRMENDDAQVRDTAAALTRCRRTPLLRVQMLQLVREGSAPFVLKQFNSSYDVYVAFKDFCECADREHAWTVLLNHKNRVIGIDEVSRGCLTSALLHPREVFKSAVLANAAKLLLIHVHPSGDPTPSADDVAITRRLREVGELLGVTLVDHVVIGHGSFVSLLDDGYL